MGIGIGNGVGWGRVTMTSTPANKAFEFTVKTDNAGTSASNQFTIPITSATSYNIETSDGQSITGATGATTLTFPSAGTYTVKITESCDGWRFNNGGDRLKLLNISNWGVFRSTTSATFQGASNMTCSAVDAPIYPQLFLTNCFRGCIQFNGAVGNWDVSQVTQFNFAFYEALNFNQPLANWDVSNGQQFDFMFDNTAFNHPIGNWNTSNALDMQGMFTNGDFNQNIDSWDVSNVTNMYAMFKNNIVFNQPLNSWDTSSVTNFQETFYNARAFNQDISSWDTSSVTNMYRTFYSAILFNQPLNNWDTSSVTTMSEMFYNTQFDQDISSWNVSNVNNFQRFMRARRAPYVNLDMSNWVFRSAGVNCNGMFAYPASAVYNTAPPIGIDSWTTTGMTNIGDMFVNCKFTGTFDVSNWDVSSVTTMSYAFWQSSNPLNLVSLSNWDTSNISDMTDAFRYFNKASGSYGFENWNISSLSSAGSFLQAATPMSTAEYDVLLVNWEAQAPTNAVNINFGSSQYTLGGEVEAARTSLINTYGWTITDGGGVAEAPFEYTFFPFGSSNAHTITTDPAYTYNYNVSVSTGETYTNQTGDLTIFFPDKTTLRTMTITGIFPALQAATNGTQTGVREIISFGSNLWRKMDRMFKGMSGLTAMPVTPPNLNLCTSFYETFHTTNIPVNNYIGTWDVSNVISMHGAFRSCNISNLDITNWDVSNVTAFLRMFAVGSGFGTTLTDITGWDTGNGTTFQEMFSYQTDFNQDISGWNMSSATNMQSMFYYTNGNLIFNQPIGNWDTSSVTNISGTLRGCGLFDQDLSNWDISNLVSQTTLFLEFGGLSTANYDATLIGWANNPSSNINIHFGTSQYTLGGAAEAARNTLVNTYNWTITDGGGIAPPDPAFIFEVNTQPNAGYPASTQYTVATRVGFSYNYNIETSDGQIFTNRTGSTVINFPAVGIYQIKITGTFPCFRSSGLNYNNDKPTRILNWGDIQWQSFNQSFTGCRFITDIPATDTPDLSLVTDMFEAFNGCQRLASFNSLPSWDVSGVTNFESTFESCFRLNEPIGSWDTSSATNMQYMFYQCSDFNQDISGWNTSNVNNMQYMFYDARSFNQPIGTWNVNNVTSMSRMFYSADVFNQDLSGWNPSSLVDAVFMFGANAFNSPLTGWSFGPNANLANMFGSNSVFNQDIGSWDVSNVLEMDFMFLNAGAFNNGGSASINNWNTSNVINMQEMFRNASAFNQPIGSWNVSNVTNMISMFDNADAFNQNIGNWNVSNVTRMFYMFESANAFNNGGSADINNWDTSSVTTMVEMFRGANSFNQPIGGWDVSNVTTMVYMFHQNTAFNQDLSAWDVSNVTNMSGMFASSVFNNGGSAGINNWNTSAVQNMSAMFAGAGSFNQPIGNWDVSSNTTMYQMFLQASSFNQDIGAWDMSSVTTIQSMFSGATAFNQNINNWNVSNITNMASAFGSSAFNQDISNWNVSNVTRLDEMFGQNPVFNQDISSWDTASVTRMEFMFNNATAFNQNISGWDTSNVSNMRLMFAGANSFNQDISGWNVSNVVNMESIFENATAFNYPLGDWNVSNVTDFRDFMLGKTAADYSAANLDDIYSKWSLQTVRPSESISFGTIQYTIAGGQAGRDVLTGAPNNWTITDGGGISSFTGLLDTYSGAAAAYSLRDLAAASVGNPVVNVRRSSDNATQDFTSTEITDGTLLAFVGNTASDNGYVTTWYDQSGNGRDAAQADTSLQPVIVSSGALVTLNGLPAIDTEQTTGTNSKYLHTDKLAPFYSVNDASIAIVAAQKPSEEAYGAFINMNYLSNIAINRNNTQLGVAGGFIVSGGTVVRNVADNTQALMLLYRNSSNGLNTFYLNNVSASNTLPTTTTTASPLWISQANNENQINTKKVIQEIILWESNLISDNSDIYANINAYY